ncbi:MAG: HlyD family efflux transporter periplasmic adaptor subunit, partial [Proteobacteria bacterium]|nr:HlyD family efflux transporter periplasmic adaptor subunit [Pseudomonadota bacterium]
ADDGRPLIIDEADHLIGKRKIDIIREVADKSGAPLVLIGEEKLSAKLMPFERAHNRVLDWVPAQPTNLADARHLVTLYARGLEIADDLLEYIIDQTDGCTRRVVANLASARAAYEGARLEAEAQAELANEGIIPAIEFRRAELAAEQLKVRLEVEQERVANVKDSVDAQLRAAEARLQQLRRNLALREQQFANLHVRAGIDGVLQALEVESGQRVTPGTNIARVARPDELMAELRIAETQAKDIRLEQPVQIDTRNGIVAGKVTRIDPAVRNGTVQVDVELLDALPPGARPDLSVDGTILIEQLENVLHVGRPAYGQSGSTLRLFRLDPESGDAARVPVELGKVSVNRVQIVNGLQEGDRVVLSDTSQWDDHDRIELN